MSKIEIFDPAMCCSTGICGPSIDKELLRVATVINNIEKKGIKIIRYGLSSNPQAFIMNTKVNELLREHNEKILPITLVNGEVVKSRAYPTNDEFAAWTGLAKEEFSKMPKMKHKKLGGCCGGNGCC
ncbi:arsenite efflux transporter metallochaperone ArsD [Anaerosinus gibii]|uniref:Arsenite efflux transporter metallochaperone ArsD n=1 Tax=Selenobaculum gibii TaxID=3054208 RepID=A0A9Y2AJN1_9FIRM|nr:arsenite efflux transporter metallochaperone ArsD [Selenobaculum gbiensis]WIW70665.1 arsenite efflux transporter metallochaperone ArsD [Selenobaculum gbiensis]